ncbi:MAG: HEAT repeat domain-containing protein [Myxococcales bacterium]|nr:HEAT repeat domain-containing protein [Myxococcales bacterium]
MMRQASLVAVLIAAVGTPAGRVAAQTSGEQAPDAVTPAADHAGQLGEDWSVQEAMGRLRSDSSDVRAAAAVRLWRLRDPVAVSSLARRLHAETVAENRRLVVVALAAIGGDEALQAVWEAAGEDPSLTVRTAAREALERAGVHVPPPVPQPQGPEPVDGEPESGLLGQGDLRLGGQIALRQLWRTDTYTDHRDEISVENDALSFGLSPVFGWFVLSWLELGFELDVLYSNDHTSEDEKRTTWGIDLLPQVRVHLALSEHVLFTVAVLLGYGYESGAVEVGSNTSDVSADGLVVGPELGIEIAADHLLIPVWLRFFYHPWSLDDSNTPDLAHDADDFVLAFGTGIHAFF